MTSKKSVLWLVLVMSILLAFSTSAWAATSLAKPKFTTNSIAAGTHGQAYSQTIVATGLTNASGDVCSLDITPAASASLKNSYDITVTVQSGGTLLLSTDKLKNPTASSGFKFTVMANNASGTSNRVTKDYTLKIAAVLPEINSPDASITSLNDLISTSTTSCAIVSSSITTVTLATVSASPQLKATATGLPKGLTISYDAQPTSGEPVRFTFRLQGTPTEAGSFKPTITISNTNTKISSKQVKRQFTLDVVASPDIKETKMADATYGNKYSQKMTVTNITKDFPLVSASVKGLPNGLTVTEDTSKGVITIAGTPTSMDKASFDEETKVASLDIGFTMNVAGLGSYWTVSRSLKVKAVKPIFTAESKKAAATAASNSDNKVGSALPTSVDLYVDAIGTVSWDISGLPAGLVSKEITSGSLKGIEVGGTPTATAKSTAVTFTATNFVGSEKLVIKYNIDGNAPTISSDVKLDSSDNNYYYMTLNSKDIKITLSSDVASVKWNAKNLPAGLKLVMSPDADAKTSKFAVISGSPTAATKDGLEVTIEATDVNNNKKGTLKTKYLRVFGKPKITTKKLGDVTLGKEYKGPIKAESVNSWLVSTDLSDQKLPAGLSFDSTDKNNPFVYGTLNTLPTSGGKPVSTIKMTLTAIGPGGTTSGEVTMGLKGEKPKITTSKLTDYAKGTASSNDITITGTKSIDVAVYITVKDAKAAGISIDQPINLLSNDYESNTGLKAVSKDATGGITIQIGSIATKGGSYKNLGITVSADNGLGVVTKTLKATMTGVAPQFYVFSGDKNVSLDNNATISKTFTAGDEFSMDIIASGDAPMTITISPKGDNAASGLSINVSSDNKGVQVRTLSSGTNAKATKLVVTAKNGQGTAKLTVNITGQNKPVIKDDYEVTKEVDKGKKLSVALSATGTKPITWAFHPDSPTKSADLKASWDIELDEVKGKLEGTTSNVTLSSDGSYYTPEVWLYAYNSAGSSDNHATVKIGVKGGKPKITSKSFEFERGLALSGDNYLLKAGELPSKDVTWTVAGNNKTLDDFIPGLTLSPDGYITGTADEAVKNKSVSVIANYLGNKQTGAIKFTVKDPDPAFTTTSASIVVNVSVLSGDEKNKTTAASTGTATVYISDDTKATGTSKISWKLSKLDKDSKKIFTLASRSDTTTDKNANNLTLTATVARGKVVEGSFSTEVTLTATNTNTKASTEMTVRITISRDIVESVTALPEDETIGETEALEEDIVTDEELTAELGEGEVRLGAERTVGMISDGQAKVLADGGYIIAAILPEISTTADGQYGFEVDLVESVPEGAKLYWFAFPNDAGSEDDEIIDFFEVNGEDTEVVPNDHVVVAYPWLRNGVTYAPVIAIKAEDASDAKDSVEDAEEGDVVTEDALEAAK